MENPPYPCCRTHAAGPVVHSPVPSLTQYASPKLIRAIAYDGHDPADDPEWARTGAPSQEEYGRWCRHLCGMVCLQMALTHRDGTAPPLWELRDGALAAGAYTLDGDEIRGLIYRPFAEYAAAVHQMGAAVHPHMSMDDLERATAAGRMAMVSVSKDIRTPDAEPARRGGHLVLVHGIDEQGVRFLNPSGHTRESRKATLPPAAFERFFGGRGISLDLRPRDTGTPSGSSAPAPLAT
ncbi:peptidase [Streptomyces sp. NPDC015350]|uniref:peptidase n=1 Tax=Streptomyces sp. NPDC015350 TaxID=3364955 RepID=UPI0036F546A6